MINKGLIYLFWFLGCLPAQSQDLRVVSPRCENRVNPLGVDVKKPAFSWQIQTDRQQVMQSAYRILVADDSLLLQRNSGNCWDTKKTVSGSSIQVEYNGKALLPAKKYFWKVMVWDNKAVASAWSPIASWQMGLPDSGDWKGAKWIGWEEIEDSMVIAPHAHQGGKKSWGARRNIMPLVRKEFSVSKPIRRATAFICGLGHFEMSVNGKKTGDHFLDPGWTNYQQHALYVTFDITQQLHAGVNAIGVMLGNGFYYIPGQRYRKMTGAYGLPKLIARMVIEYADGSVQDMVTDESWKAAPSPTIFSSIFGGEDYDANLEIAGWDQPSFDDSQWKKVVITKGPPRLDAQSAEPVKVMQRFTPLSHKKISPGLLVFDLGQNFSGIPSIRVSGQKGDTVRMYPAELLKEDGTANQRGSGGPAYYTYVLNGNGPETWQPRFSYYGFRYVEVHCIPKDSTQTPPAIHQLEGLHIRNAADQVGNFHSSNQLFNQTFDLINWAIRSNTVSVFTDCPHREKLGWLEQTHLMGNSVQFNYDIATLCRKVIEDMKMAQTPEGLIPEIAPEFVQFGEPFRDSPEWGSAAILLPWYLYQWYADKRTLKESYAMMDRYIGYLESKAQDHILMQGLGDWYDLGPQRPGFAQLTPAGLTATAIYYHDLIILSKIARLLGNAGDASRLEGLAKKVKDAFNKKFFDREKMQYGSGSQTANAMALYMDLVEPAYKKQVLESLVKDIRDRNYALTAGDIGYRYLLKALQESGRSDIIYNMNSRDDVPGYGYQLKQGATALTESWQAYPSVSNNHFMLGHLMEWFYEGLGGISLAPGSTGFKNLIIKPQVVGDLDSVSVNFQSPYGTIGSSWKKKNGNLELQITIPPNTRATVYFPPNEKYKQSLSLGSGKYKFSIKLKQQ